MWDSKKVPSSVFLPYSLSPTSVPFLIISITRGGGAGEAHLEILISNIANKHCMLWLWNSHKWISTTYMRIDLQSHFYKVSSQFISHSVGLSFIRVSRVIYMSNCRDTCEATFNAFVMLPDWSQNHDGITIISWDANAFGGECFASRTEFWYFEVSNRNWTTIPNNDFRQNKRMGTERRDREPMYFRCKHTINWRMPVSIHHVYKLVSKLKYQLFRPDYFYSNRQIKCLFTLLRPNHIFFTRKTCSKRE